MTGKNIYMLGIKGVGMTSLALIYHRMGNVVVGSDVDKHFITDPVLEKYGIPVYKGFDPAHISNDIDLAVMSGAHSNSENTEFLALQKTNVKLQSHAEALGELMDTFDVRISVCGSHGKTTTSAMLATIFLSSGKKGAHHVGVPTFSGLDGGAYNGTDYFIAEADEYANNPHIDNTPRFSFQHPNILLCTNIDFDHPDIYTSLGDVQKAFTAFMTVTISNGGRVVYCADDFSTSAAIKGLDFDKLYSYGFSKSADLTISDVNDSANSTSFRATFRGDDLGEFSLRIGGKHNILNAAGALLVSRLAGLNETEIVNGLSQFTGSARRYELIAQHNTTYLYDDYAHHPREIEAVIQASRIKFPSSRIVLIFQPHTFSRTNMLGDSFASALQKADRAYILEIFSSEREKNTALTSSNLGKLHTAHEVLEDLKLENLDNTVIITMGAGDVYTMHPELISLINEKI